jgi:hypothetical protein
VAPHSTRIHLTPYGSMLDLHPGIAGRPAHRQRVALAWRAGAAAPGPEERLEYPRMAEGDHEDVVVRTLVTGEVSTLWLRGDLDVVARVRLANAIKKSDSRGRDRPHGRRLGRALHRLQRGVGALLDGQRLGATLVIRNPVPNVRRVLDIIGVNTFATIENT